MVSRGARGNRVRWKGIRGMFNVVSVGFCWLSSVVFWR